MWNSQASTLSPHMLDAIGTKKLSGLFVTSSTKQFQHTCLSVVIATQKNQTKVTMDNWSLGCKRNAIV
jgi:hypothetical protein